MSLTIIGVSDRAAEAYPRGRRLTIPPQADKVEKESREPKKIEVFVTAYYGPRPGQKRYARGSYRRDVKMNGAGKETRAGTVPDISTAAADWRILKKGTRFRIPECHEVVLGTFPPKLVSEIIYTVLDTGGAVKGRHVDIFVGHGDPGCKVAKDFDCKKYVIEILE